MGACISFCSTLTKQPKASQPQQGTAGTPGGTQGGTQGGTGAHEPVSTKPTTSSSSEYQFAYYKSLPSGVEKVSIEHVYDGDTLTINEYNRARIRLRGSDAPELKEKEPYAAESADLVKALCPKKATVWLQFDKDEREDTYGRLLAYVFTENPNKGAGGYICVNVATIEKGLANYYAPGGSSISKETEMLNAAKNARKGKLNIWKNFNTKQIVYKTRNGSAFHKEDCENVQNARLTSMTLGEAMDMGLSPCRTCKPA